MARRSKPAAKVEALPIASVDDLAQSGTEGQIKLVKVEGVTQAFQVRRSCASLGLKPNSLYFAVDRVELGPARGGGRRGSGTACSSQDVLRWDRVRLRSRRRRQGRRTPLRLAFNLEDDPQEVAMAFQGKHALPVSYVDQIREFILHAR